MSIYQSGRFSSARSFLCVSNGPSRKSARIYVACRLAFRVKYVCFPLLVLDVERFSVQYRKTKTKVNTPTKNRLKQHNEPIRTRSKYM